jgi:transposase
MGIGRHQNSLSSRDCRIFALFGHPIFLPPYTPFYNPIEVLFSILKSRLKKIHKENGDILQELTEVVTKLTDFRATNLYLKMWIHR